MSFPVVKVLKTFFVPVPELFLANLTIFLIIFSARHSYAQDNVFSAQIITDVNFSQIRGDLLAGYHRVGYGAGVGISYRMAPMWNAHVHLMYRNAGSRSSPFTDVKRSIDIHMAQIPVYASYLTWWDNGLSRIHFDIGMVFGRVVRSRIDFPQFEENLPFIRQNDFSLLAGMGFWFNIHHGLNVRYIRSLTTLMENQPEDIRWKMYYISMQYLYRF